MSQSLSLSPSVSLSDLSVDLLSFLSHYLSLRDICSLIQCNHFYEQIFSSSLVWDSLSLRLLHLNQFNTQQQQQQQQQQSSLSPYVKIKQSYHLCKAIKQANYVNQLFHQIVYVSSVDREEENERNVLTISLCHLRINSNHQFIQQNPRFGLHFQSECGCLYGHPCYWSSKGSNQADSSEELIFTTTHSLILLTRFSITVYQAFFHSNYPIYAPHTVQLILLHKDRHTPYYHSPIYEVQSTSQQQIFEFDLPILFCGGFVRLLFHGKRQVQTVGDPDYYLCICHASLEGYPITSFQSIEQLPQQKMSSQSQSHSDRNSYFLITPS